MRYRHPLAVFLSSYVCWVLLRNLYIQPHQIVGCWFAFGSLSNADFQRSHIRFIFPDFEFLLFPVNVSEIERIPIEPVKYELRNGIFKRPVCLEVGVTVQRLQQIAGCIGKIIGV